MYKITQTFKCWFSLGLLYSATAFAASSTVDNGSTTMDKSPATGKGIAELIRTTNIRQFQADEEAFAHKVKFLLMARTADAEAQDCVVDLSAAHHCATCATDEFIPHVIAFECGHQHHPKCIIQALPAIAQKSVTTGGFACPVNDCKSTLMSHEARGLLKKAKQPSTLTLITHILPQLQSFIPCHSCQAGGIISPHDKHDYYGIQGTCNNCKQKRCFKCDGSAHRRTPCNFQEVSKQVEFLQHLVHSKTAGKFGYCPQCDHAVMHPGEDGQVHCKADHTEGNCDTMFPWTARKTVSEQLKTLDEAWWHAHASLIEAAETEGVTTAEATAARAAAVREANRPLTAAEIEQRMRKIKLMHAGAAIASLVMSSGLFLGPMFIHAAYNAGPFANISLGTGLGLGIPLTLLGYAGYPLLAQYDAEFAGGLMMSSAAPILIVGGLILIISAATGGPIVGLTEDKEGIIIGATFFGILGGTALCCLTLNPIGPSLGQHFASLRRDFEQGRRR